MGYFDLVNFDNAIILILSYLRATDLVCVSEANKAIFTKQRISAAVQLLMTNKLPVAIVTPCKKQFSIATAVYRPDSLFVFEVTSVLNALLTPSPPPGKGFWISSAWMSNAKKFLESLTLPDVEANTFNYHSLSVSSTPKKGTPKKKTAKLRQRRGSDALPPWPIVNADLICPHNQLSLAKAPNAPRRKAIDSRAWLTIRRYYGLGPEYRCSAVECTSCLSEQQQSWQSVAEKRDAALEQRRLELAPPSLAALLERKQGVPEHCIHRDFIDEEEPVFTLREGLYNLVPRDWLRQWRRYTRDLTAPSLPVLDCTRLICYSHGLLVLPPHLEEYLVGARRSLLGGLGAYEGEVVELVSAEEWDELLRINKGMADFGVRFCLHEGSLSWNIGVCQRCDPFSDATYASSNRELLRGSSIRARNAALGVV
eukprot:gene31430-37988_t